MNREPRAIDHDSNVHERLDRRPDPAVKSEEVVVRGLLRTWRVPRSQIISVTDYAALVWRDFNGRVRSTPMLVLATGKTLDRWRYITVNQRAALREALGLDSG